MDPNETLRIMRQARRDMAMASDAPSGHVLAEEAAERLYHATEALDQWLSAGGFLPDAWQSNGTVRSRPAGQLHPEILAALSND